MKLTFNSIVFICLTSFSVITSNSVIAGGCNSSINKNVKIECLEDDTKCQTNEAKKYELDKTVRS